MDKGLTRFARVFPDLDTLSRAAIEECVRRTNEAVATRGRCLVALSGGHTPSRAYEIWAAEYCEKTPWPRMHFFWGDERFVSANDPRSNDRMAQQQLFQHGEVPPENIHAIRTDFPGADAAARAYDQVLRQFISEDGLSFDIVFLGIGVEGHTASLFPGSPALNEEKSWVVAVRAPIEPPVRISLTFPILRRARHTYFLVAGAQKREIIATLRRDPEAAAKTLPCAMLHPEGETILFLDSAADAEPPNS